MPAPLSNKRIALVLGGGGMKGLAHVGVLKVLRSLNIHPSEYIGTSIGSLFAAMAAGDMSPEDMESIALTTSKNEIIDYNVMGLLRQGTKARSIYIGKKFHTFVRRVLPVDRFSELKYPLYINSVNINTGHEIIWGLPGLTDVPIHDCICASCAIPGIFPPKKINQYYFSDGGLVDTIPIKIAINHGADVIIAVHLEAMTTFSERNIQDEGLVAMIAQAQSIVSQTFLQHNLSQCDKSNIILIEPEVSHYGMFDFINGRQMIDEGARAAGEILRNHPLLRGKI